MSASELIKYGLICFSIDGAGGFREAARMLGGRGSLTASTNEDLSWSMEDSVDFPDLLRYTGALITQDFAFGRSPWIQACMHGRYLYLQSTYF